MYCGYDVWRIRKEEMAQTMNTLLLIALTWAGAMVVFGVFIWALGRAAAIGDREDLEQMRAATSLVRSARTGPADRRASRRPWGNQAPGRRDGDARRWEVEEARQALVAAEAELAPYEAGHGNDPA